MEMVVTKCSTLGMSYQAKQLTVRAKRDTLPSIHDKRKRQKGYAHSRNRTMDLVISRLATFTSDTPYHWFWLARFLFFLFSSLFTNLGQAGCVDAGIPFFETIYGRIPRSSFQQ